MIFISYGLLTLKMLSTKIMALISVKSTFTNFYQPSSDIVIDGMKHWQKVQTQSSSNYWTPPHRQSNPIDIEMTSYALLVYGAQNHISDGLPVMNWITSQRNPQGGFSSTQVISKTLNILCISHS